MTLHLSPLAFLFAAFVSTTALATPATTNGTAKTEAKKHVGSAAADKAAAKRKNVEKRKETDVDVSGMHATSYTCEQGGKLTMYKNVEDGQVALEWKARKHRMHRKETTTGAERYENPDSGLVWIGIPAKSILLDSKKGRQLANECRNAEQRKLLQK